MRWILAVAGMFATTTGCDVLACGDGTAHTTWRWEGEELPRATLIATASASTGVVWDDDRLSVVADDQSIVTSTLELAAPRAIAMAPDGTGIVVGGAMKAQVFDPLGVPGGLVDIDKLTAEAPAAVFDGTAFSVVWSVGQQVFHARVSTTGQLLQGRTLIGVGAPECPRLGAVAVAALDDHSAWIAWTAGSSAEPEIVAVRLVGGAVDGPPRSIATVSSPPLCGTGALRGLAASGMDAMLLLGQTVIPLRADGTTGTPADIGPSPVTLIGAQGGFALVKPYESGAFPRDLYTRMRMLEKDGTEVLQINVRGASGVYALFRDRLMAATGVDITVEDDGTSTLGVTRFYGDEQSLPTVLDEAHLAHVSHTTCTPAEYGQ